jgi:O-antigen/teichoic acid export membrane protein
MKNRTQEGVSDVTAVEAAVPITVEYGKMVRQIDHGVHVTFLLSLVALPLSYLTQVILARTSPEAVGIYGAILLWVAAALCFCYFGSNSVLIKFLPEVSPDGHLPFLLSYSVLVLGCTLLGVLPFVFSPHLFQLLAGRQLDSSVVPPLLVIALLNVFQQVLISSLKGLLELALAQVLTRIITVGCFVSFGGFFFLARSWFRAHLFAAIAGVHIAFMALSLLLGAFSVLRKLKFSPHVLRWHLPDRFWHFTVLTEISSIVTFLYSRLDQVMVLFYGSITGLGIYFVLAQLAVAIQLISGFFLDGVLPALTNVLARVGTDAARSVYYEAARLNQVIITGCTLALLCFSRLVLGTFGPQYFNHWQTYLILVTFSGINSLGSLNAQLMTATGRVSLLLCCQISQVLVFLMLFGLLGGKQSLSMLALAQGLSMTVGLVVTMVATTQLLELGLRIPREFRASLAVLLPVAGLISWAGPLSVVRALFLLLLASAAFFVIAGYRWPEIRALIALIRIPTGSNNSLRPATRIFTGLSGVSR